MDKAIDTAARFGEIPYVSFTTELVKGVFDALVDAHILQMEEYATFAASLTQSLSAYINNTKDDVSFNEISEFVLNYELPKVDETTLGTVLGALETPTTSSPSAPPSTPPSTPTADMWWGSLINSLAPAVEQLVDKIDDPNLPAELTAIKDYNEGVSTQIPNYQQIHDAVASIIASNKYGILQSLVKQGMMRLVVTEGEIETRITFSTWNTSERSQTVEKKKREREKYKTVKGGGIIGIFRKKRKLKNRTITINTAKSYQRDTSGSRVDIFGRVLIRFKSNTVALRLLKNLYPRPSPDGPLLRIPVFRRVVAHLPFHGPGILTSAAGGDTLLEDLLQHAFMETVSFPRGEKRRTGGVCAAPRAPNGRRIPCRGRYLPGGRPRA